MLSKGQTVVGICKVLLQHYVSKASISSCQLSSPFNEISHPYLSFSFSAPSLIGMVRKDWASQNSIALSWQEPDFPKGAILDYEIKYYEKVYPRIAPAFWHYLRVEEHEQLSYSSTRSKAPSVIVTGLKPATKYIFHIRVRTATGYSGYSQKFEFETGDERLRPQDSGHWSTSATS
ncbi:Ephrin type-A receptor 6 [Varanus komodoensis]|nr:Ephrin type-A receptor 6 [Varanus komodoensis]